MGWTPACKDLFGVKPCLLTMFALRRKSGGRLRLTMLKHNSGAPRQTSRASQHSWRRDKVRSLAAFRD